MLRRELNEKEHIKLRHQHERRRANAVQPALRVQLASPTKAQKPGLQGDETARLR